VLHTKGKPQLVEIEWLDARTVYAQLDYEDVEQKCKLSSRVSVGYLVKRDREMLVIAHTHDPAEPEVNTKDGGADFTIIPRGWVTKLTKMTMSQDPDVQEEA